MSRTFSRRRFIAISAAVAGLAATGARAAAPLRKWRGTALGADAALSLAHPDPARADALIAACLAEVRRLEAVFSLYRPDSALVRLNRDGRLAAPPLELVDLLSRARTFSEATQGAFDVTVQPLWRLLADHFRRPGADPAGPAEDQMAAARARVGYRHLHIEAEAIAFTRTGMAVTANGIAQGYITDRVANLLRDAGMTDMLVHMGETRALGGHPDGRAWRIGLNEAKHRIELRDAAVATSGEYGFRFAEGAGHHHILDPRTGTSPARWREVSVIAGEATTADALSTAMMMLDADRIAALARRHGADVHALDADGRRRMFPGRPA